jgi:hypothetical protein
MKIHPVEAELFHADGLTDIETYTYDKANSRFSPFCERTSPTKNAAHAVYFRRSVRNLRCQPTSGYPPARTDTHKTKSKWLHFPSKLSPFTVTQLYSFSKNFMNHLSDVSKGRCFNSAVTLLLMPSTS